MIDLRMRGLSPDRFTGTIEADKTRKRIGVILFEGFSLLLAGTVAETLHIVNRLLEDEVNVRSGYDVHVLSTTGGSVSSASSVFIKTVKCDDSQPPGGYHAVFVAVGTGVDNIRTRDSDNDRVRAVIESADSVFLIGHGQRKIDLAGLEWLRPSIVRALGANETRAANPVDAAITIVERDLGSETARRVAQGMELVPRWNFHAMAGKRAAAKLSEQIQTSARWLEANAGRAITIDEAAQVALMSTRNYLRRFKLETGMTPSEYLLQVRIERCCRLLVSTSLPVDKIARRCGMGSGGQLSKIFRKHLDSTPTEFRTKVQLPDGLA